ncbi:MAG: hypothetical protein FWH03_04615 [Firmicutes bacterium]|nr:hypothetical protein [Bacillota bacterium]
MKTLKKCIIIILVAALLCAAAFSGCGPKISKPIPVDGTVFVGRYLHGNATVVVLYDNAAYVGYQKKNAGYATFRDRFTRLSLSFDGTIYRVTNLSSLWQSAVTHDAYPQGFIFNENDTLTWISPIPYPEDTGSTVTLDGNKFPAWPFTKLDGVKVDKLADSPKNLRIDQTTLYCDTPHEFLFVEQTGQNVQYGFGTNPINLDDWDFLIAGEAIFKLRSLGGFPTYGTDGFLQKLTVSSDVSLTSAAITVASGEQLAKPVFRVERQLNAIGIDCLYIYWDEVPNARVYLVGESLHTTETLTTVHMSNVGSRALTVTAKSNQKTVNGVITIFPSSEPAVIILNIKEDGTFSYTG